MNNGSNLTGNNGNNHDIAQNSNPRNDVNGVFNDAQRNRLNSGLILAEENKGNLGSRLPDKNDSGSINQGSGTSGTSSSSSSSSTSSSSGSSSSSSSFGGSSYSSNGGSNSRNNINADNMRKMMLQHGAQQYLGKKIPPALARKVINSSAGQSALNKLAGQRQPNLLDKLADRDKFLDERPEDIDSSSEADKKSDALEKSKIIQGEISAQIPRKVLKYILILAPFVALILFFSVAVLSYINDEKISSMEISEATSEKTDEELKELAVETGDGKGKGNTGTGKGAENIPKEYADRLAYLGNLYTTELKCKGDDCLDRPEFKYYLKIADIAYRYKEKYSVKLDWLLISATDLYFAKDTEQIMKDNLGGYSESSVKNTDSTMSLDWDYDYKNIKNYDYLNADDSTYDLQILAKNMVKKKTTQTCYDGNGNTTKTQEDEDVEEKYFKANGSKRLKCGAGEKYDIFSTYDIDMEKYDEFMLEYIYNKMYSQGSGKKDKKSHSSVNGNDLSEVMVNLALEQLNDSDAYNGHKYWSFMGFGGRVEWCACFVSWVVAHTEHNGQSLSDITHYDEIDGKPAVYNWMNYFYNSDDLEFKFNDNCSRLSGKNGGSGTYTPKQGDLIFFDWNGVFNSMPTDYGHVSHIGIVQRTEDNVIYTIEGNSSNMVAERTYPIDSCNVVGFGSWY